MAWSIRRRWAGWWSARLRPSPGSSHSTDGLDAVAVELLEQRWAEWPRLEEAERVRLGRLAAGLMRTLRWEAAQGFAVTDEMRVLIAAQASLLLLGLELDGYPATPTVIVHRSAMVQRGQRSVGVGRVQTSGPRRVHGLAVPRGPVVLSWSAVEADLRRPERGQNVVYHEFAHRLDMLDGAVDGSPPLGDERASQRWVEVFTAAYEQLRAGEGSGVLRAYGATTPAEFFAVATEAFMLVPHRLAAAEPSLYDELAAFYGQDPRRRHRDPGADASG